MLILCNGVMMFKTSLILITMNKSIKKGKIRTILNFVTAASSLHQNHANFPHSSFYADVDFIYLFIYLVILNPIYSLSMGRDERETYLRFFYKNRKGKINIYIHRSHINF